MERKCQHFEGMRLGLTRAQVAHFGYDKECDQPVVGYTQYGKEYFFYCVEHWPYWWAMSPGDKRGRLRK
jgi:hypothetical protein